MILRLVFVLVYLHLQKETNNMGNKEHLPKFKIEGGEINDLLTEKNVRLPPDIQSKVSKIKDFVGLIVLGKDIYSFLPKIFTEEISNSEKSCELTRIIYRVLQTYRNNNPKTSSSNVINIIGGSQESGNSTIFGIINELIDDWFSYGVWKPYEMSYCILGNGGVNWDKTIQEHPALISNTTLCHDPVINNHFTINEHHILSHIHTTIMEDITHKYDWLFPELPSHVTATDIRYDAAEFTTIIKEHLLYLSNQRERILFEHLLLYLEKTPQTDIDNPIQVYGTIAFHRIFEHMLQKLLRDYRNHESLQAIKEPPQWKLTTPENDTWSWKGSGGDADIVLPYKNGTYNTEFTSALILDAKYFRLAKAIQDRDESLLPKIEDIRKQYMYGIFLLQMVDTIQSIRNAFIFPVPEYLLVPNSHFYHFGDVTFPIYEPLCVLGVNLEWLMKQYLKLEVDDIANIHQNLWNITKSSERTRQE